MMLSKRKCTLAASMPNAAQRARQLCMAARASCARAAPAAPARQVLEWKTMPRYLKLVTASSCPPPKLSRAASAALCAAVPLLWVKLDANQLHAARQLRSPGHVCLAQAV